MKSRTVTIGEMAITKLRHFRCSQPIPGYGTCDEEADYTVKAKDGLSVHYCADHAQRFLAGEVELKRQKCMACPNVFAPGKAVVSRLTGRGYCSVHCLGVSEGSDSVRRVQSDQLYV